MSKSIGYEPKVGEKVVPNLNHTWDFCSQCGWHVKCANCGNHCCNGGSNDYCPDNCNEAYHIQDDYDYSLMPEFIE